MKKLFLAMCFSVAMMSMVEVNAQKLNLATYNLRNANKEDSTDGNGWGKRFPVIANMVKYYGFDIWGTQEGKSWQLQDLINQLPDYSYIGIGRDDGKKEGEYSAIFYNKKKITVVESGNFWLSQDTTKPNKGWDAVLPRICTWGKFKLIKSGKEFYMFNLHMDHIGVVARAESSKLILAKIKNMKVKIPIVLTGDFNVNQSSESFLLLDKSNVLKDSYRLTNNKLASAGTYNGFGNNLHKDERIDHIFLSDAWKVNAYGILTDGYVDKDEKSGKYLMRYPSDHFPVLTKLSF
ncbi:endonuclease/exonuclease/phosphatase family protein [Rhizosphaericola mali]|uniref:Endonuclease/exonuclease/phosphatase family protein n=1 Tax=Rhizosphaericola mali TaxID=2545455 RepID=A0A5P2G6C3_9BACT|nr:endonuclease/exonuclease/phosphatase family protein [Rhizosphaericola mali]QES89809.1 endonuclease/exonuclease/phosphatase family protein [Rhizosphaericola mali]